MENTHTTVEERRLLQRRSQTLPVVETRDILGVEVSVLARRAAVERVATALDHDIFFPVAFLNANGANIAAQNAVYRSTLKHFTILADGFGVDIASRLLYGAEFPANLNGTDFLPVLLDQLAGPLNIGLYGARPTVAEKAADTLHDLAPHHRFRVLGDGYGGAAVEVAMLEELRANPVDILFVALGNPAQELWIADHITPDHAMVPVGVGALFDFLAGEVQRAPQWVIDIRAEWLFRLGVEPGRLWRRYVLGNPVFLARVARQKLSRKP